LVEQRVDLAAVSSPVDPHTIPEFPQSVIDWYAVGAGLCLALFESVVASLDVDPYPMRPVKGSGFDGDPCIYWGQAQRFRAQVCAVVRNR
jgi:hypothetical protein